MTSAPCLPLQLANLSIDFSPAIEDGFRCSHWDIEPDEQQSIVTPNASLVPDSNLRMSSWFNALIQRIVRSGNHTHYPVIQNQASEVKPKLLPAVDVHREVLPLVFRRK